MQRWFWYAGYYPDRCAGFGRIYTGSIFNGIFQCNYPGKIRGWESQRCSGEKWSGQT